MNKYLLLRDNKQSGPYTCEELQAKGVKAYDLVWIEGKSAAWRYPSEVEELKPFSPVVEEQPFERFYKKPIKQEEPRKSTPREQAVPINTPEPANQTIISEPVIQPVRTEPPVKKIEKPVIPAAPPAPKKVYINFPASVTARTAAVSDNVGDTEKQIPSATPVPVTTPRFPASVEKTAQSDSQLRRTDNKYPEAQKPNNRALLTVLAAACILLIGVVIGLVYSYNAKLNRQHELEQLVEQMKKSQAVPEATVPAVTDNPTNTNNAADETSNLTADNTASLGIPAVSKENKSVPEINKPKKQTALQVKNEIAKASSETTIKEPVPAPPEVDESRPVKTLEQNRKTIFQKVNLENNDYKTGVLGGINNLQLTLTNKSNFLLEEVEVEVKYLGSENRVVKTQTVYFTNVSPGEQLSVKVPKSNRGVSVEYSVKKINTKELGMAIAGS
ncbi:MAG TPA: hypothetical protein VM012_08275 [Flavitalea sp.]|nr:hypothetical protein [Flavitalea sp.]